MVVKILFHLTNPSFQQFSSLVFLKGASLFFLFNQQTLLFAFASSCRSEKPSVGYHQTTIYPTMTVSLTTLGLRGHLKFLIFLLSGKPSATVLPMFTFTYKNCVKKIKKANVWQFRYTILEYFKQRYPEGRSFSLERLVFEAWEVLES